MTKCVGTKCLSSCALFDTISSPLFVNILCICTGGRLVFSSCSYIGSSMYLYTPAASTTCTLYITYCLNFRFYLNWCQFLFTGIIPLAFLLVFNYKIFRGIRSEQSKTTHNKKRLTTDIVRSSAAECLRKSNNEWTPKRIKKELLLSLHILLKQISMIFCFYMRKKAIYSYIFIRK